ncbi:MAG: hypothetical protein GY812_12915 [Actinomycetia bacterium]|nr:hypothetical protein [Actinomycetes bacterium]
MASLRTEITEIVTGLGTLGDDDPQAALAGAKAPPELRNVDDGTWDRLRGAFADRNHEGEFLAAFNNGRALLRATDGLRDRHPVAIEWKGSHRDPADHAVPADLRIDHVYLVSCKYASKVLHNASPSALFDRCLTGAAGQRSGDWFAEVAPAEHQAHYQAVRRLVEGGEQLPERVGDLDTVQRRQLAQAREVTSPDTAIAYAELAEVVSRVSAQRWNSALGTDRERRSMLWRLLRLSATPYFVLGTGRGESLRLRVATPWDWNQAWQLDDFEIGPQAAGQPQVTWSAAMSARDDSGQGGSVEVVGHVEIRWSHGRLGGSPEAKVYLDTPHRQVPGYIPLV